MTATAIPGLHHGHEKGLTFDRLLISTELQSRRLLRHLVRTFVAGA